MLNRKNRVVVPIVFSIMLVVLLLGGVLAGLWQDWFRMGLLFFLGVFIVNCCVSVLLDLKIDTCFKRLEDLTSGKSDSTRVRK